MLDKALLGVDVNRQWQQWNGDLVLIDGTDNVAQALFNRLTCRYNDMAYFYLNYGSRIREWMGRANYQQNLDGLANEVQLRVLEDPRVSDCEVECTKYDSYNVIIKIHTIINENQTFVSNFVLNTNSNTLNYFNGSKTYIKLTLYRWTCEKPKKRYQVRPNGTLRILCKVLTPQDEGVPIGTVDYYLNNHFIKSVDIKKGYADCEYTMPYDSIKGTYILTAHYRGLGSFGSSKEQIELDVVDKLDTETKFKYKYLYGIAGKPVNFPVSVKDINGDNVTSGTVCYSLKIGGKWRLGTDLTISNMYKRYDEQRAVFQHSTLYDELGDPVPCGRVCYYIKNGDGILRATRNILSSTYMKETSDVGFFNGRVKDEYDINVPFGKYCWWLRTSSGIPMETETKVTDTTAYHGFQNEFTATITDEMNYPVQDGIFCWYVKCIRECKPFVTKTEITDVDVRNIKTFINATVKDIDGLNINESTVCFNLSDLPIDITSEDIPEEDLSPDGLYAMIVDQDGVVIDRGKFITETVNGNVVSTYISSDEFVEDERTIKFKLQEDN